MPRYIFHFATNAPALRAAGTILKAAGYAVTPLPDQTVTHLVLPIPSFDTGGNIKGGGDLQQLLRQLPENVTIIGGNLPKALCDMYPTIDLLQDSVYLADNAAITAHCALRLAMMELPITLHNCSALIIGWGRISQCLAQLLRAVGAHVTIAARKETDRALAHALGYHAVAVTAVHETIGQYRVIFNTAPAPVLSAEDADRCDPDCLKIDLASRLGIGGRHVLWARGLPGKDVPESSGKLIAQSILRLIHGKEETS